MRAYRCLTPVISGLVLLLGSLLTPNAAGNTVALAAVTYIVNDAGSDCGSYTATYSSIQAAVDDAIDNNVKTILVCPGLSYSSFVVNGANKLTIKAALAGTFPKVNPPTNATSGRIVDVQNSTGVVLDGLKIDGTAFYDELSSNTYGISFRNASGTVQNSTITRIRCIPPFACDYGYGIFVEDYNGDGKASTVIIKKVNITDFERAGVAAFGPTKVTVSDTSIIGNFSGGLAYGPAGVNFLSGTSTGSVKNTTISAVGTGVLIEGASKVTVSGSTIFDVHTGIYIRALCTLTQMIASSNKIIGNSLGDIENNAVAIEASGPGCTSHADKNTISGNRIGGADGSVSGTKFYVDPGMSADKNVISGNTFAGFAADVVIDPDATNTKVSNNTWLP